MEGEGDKGDEGMRGTRRASRLTDSLLVYELRPVRSHGILVSSAFLVKT
jgi:hypothetical protein